MERFLQPLLALGKSQHNGHLTYRIVIYRCRACYNKRGICVLAGPRLLGWAAWTQIWHLFRRAGSARTSCAWQISKAMALPGVAWSASQSCGSSGRNHVCSRWDYANLDTILFQPAGAFGNRGIPQQCGPDHQRQDHNWRQPYNHHRKYCSSDNSKHRQHKYRHRNPATQQ